MLLVAVPLPVPELRTSVDDVVESPLEEVGLGDTPETALNVGETASDVVKDGVLKSEDKSEEIAELIAPLEGTATDDRAKEEVKVSLGPALEAEVPEMEN